MEDTRIGTDTPLGKVDTIVRRLLYLVMLLCLQRIKKITSMITTGLDTLLPEEAGTTITDPPLVLPPYQLLTTSMIDTTTKRPWAGVVYTLATTTTTTTEHRLEVGASTRAPVGSLITTGLAKITTILLVERRGTCLAPSHTSTMMMLTSTTIEEKILAIMDTIIVPVVTQTADLLPAVVTTEGTIDTTVTDKGIPLLLLGSTAESTGTPPRGMTTAIVATGMPCRKPIPTTVSVEVRTIQKEAMPRFKAPVALGASAKGLAHDVEVLPPMFLKRT